MEGHEDEPLSTSEELQQRLKSRVFREGMAGVLPSEALAASSL